MIKSWFLSNKAVLIIFLGTAFFLAGCRADIPIKERPPKEVAGEAQEKMPREPREEPAEAATAKLDLAEDYIQADDLESALETYEGYLAEFPMSDKAAMVMHRAGDIALKMNQYEKAFAFFERISQEHSDYQEMPVVQMQMVECLIRLGEYESSKETAILWTENYPDHSLLPNIYFLLGRNNIALAQKDMAFYWWSKALKLADREDFTDLRMASELDARLEGLIEASEIEDLEKFEEYATGSPFTQKLYYRMANIYLNTADLEKAKLTTMALVRSTSEQYWVSRGRELFERIREERSVKRYVIGCLLPLSGRFSIYGQEVLNGIQLGMAPFGDLEKISKVELVIRDTEGDPKMAAKGLEELVRDEEVIAVIGPLASKTAIEAAKKSEDLGIPIITLTQKAGITEERSSVFRNFLTPSKEVDKLTDTVFGEFGAKRFAFLFPDNSYGRFLTKLFWERLEQLGGIVTAAESYKTDQTDFAIQIKKMTGLYHPRPQSVIEKLKETRLPEEEESQIKPDKPQPIVDFDAVFIPDTYQRVIMIAPQLAYHDVLDVLLVGTSLWQSPELIEKAGDYVEQSVFTTGFFADALNPDVERFIAAYKDNFESDPGILAASGYDTIGFLKDMVENRQFRTRKEFQDALMDWPCFEGVTGDICFDVKGEVKKEPLVLTVLKKNITTYK